MAYNQHLTAESNWQALTAKRTAFMDRCELYASYTLPKICPPRGYDQNTHELSHDYQAVGAQATNHLANKIMLSLFAPSRPFFRADPDDKMAASFAEQQITPATVAEALAQAEKAAVNKLDRMALRPKLYEVIKHLIITGNVLYYMHEKESRVIGLNKYLVRRSPSGRIVEFMIGDRVRVDELSEAVQRAMQPRRNADDEVNHYRWFTRKGDDFVMTQWIDSQRLPDNFNGKWSEETCPYRVLTWDLSDGADYGTGLVEDYSADFAGLSALSRAQVVGAVLASEFRWLVNPAGMTKPEDFEASQNGSAIPGNEGDIVLIQSGKANDLQVTLNLSTEYVNRIGRGFLLGASLVRNAERVTAEEIRLLANELETALGGAYSRLAVDIQLPMARWLMDMIGLTMNGSGFQPTIVTGLEALSRNGDLEELKALFMDLALVAQLPEVLQGRLQMEEVMKAFAAARRVQIASLFKSEQQLQQEQQAAQQRQIEQAAAAGAIDASAKAAAQPQGQPAE